MEDGNSCLPIPRCTHPDLDLNGYSTPGVDGVLATKKSKRHYPDIKIIILTTLMMMNLSIVRWGMVLQVIF